MSADNRGTSSISSDAARRRQSTYRTPPWRGRTEPTNAELRIAVALVKGDTQTGACIKGGFSPTTATKKAHEIVRRPGVRAGLLKLGRVMVELFRDDVPGTEEILSPILNNAGLTNIDLIIKLREADWQLKMLCEVYRAEAEEKRRRQRQEQQQYERLDRRVQELKAAEEAARQQATRQQQPLTPQPPQPEEAADTKPTAPSDPDEVLRRAAELGRTVPRQTLVPPSVEDFEPPPTATTQHTGGL